MCICTLEFNEVSPDSEQYRAEYSYSCSCSILLLLEQMLMPKPIRNFRQDDNLRNDPVSKILFYFVRFQILIQ